jgi:rubrerythrin
MKAQRYVCPKCGNSILLHVKPSEPPLCRNPKFHSTTAEKMQVK